MSSDEKNRFPLVPVSCPADCDFESNILVTYGIEGKLFSNVCIRALNSIYYNAPRVKPGDEGDFAGYCLSSLGAIRGHHENAEKIFFPILQKKYDMTPFVQQYASYRDPINALNEYLKTVAAKGPYDGQKVRELVDSFGGKVAQTFRDGVESINYEHLKEYDESDVKEMLQAHVALLEKLIKETPLSIFIMGHHDPKTAPTWPPRAKRVGPLDKLDVYANTKGYWKFAPYSITHGGETQTYA